MLDDSAGRAMAEDDNDDVDGGDYDDDGSWTLYLYYQQHY